MIALALVACSRASDEGGAKKWQEAPPPTQVAVPAGLSIAVQVDGADKPPITSDVLKATKPDFVDDDHRAWKIPTLVGEAAGKISAALGPQQPGRRPLSLTRCEGLHQAVVAAAGVARPGDVVLLAPGGTSFDEFKDFEERGESFTKWVHELT